MNTINKNINSDGIVDGIWISDESNDTIFIPFSLCIVLADALTFSDRDVVGSTEFIGYVQLFYDFDGSISLSDGQEEVSIDKCDIKEFVKLLWDLV